MKSRTCVELMRELEPLRVLPTLLAFEAPTPKPREASKTQVHVASTRKTREQNDLAIRAFRARWLCEYHASTCWCSMACSGSGQGRVLPGCCSSIRLPSLVARSIVSSSTDIGRSNAKVRPTRVKERAFSW